MTIGLTSEQIIAEIESVWSGGVTLSGKRVVRPITAYKIVPNEKDQE